MCVCVCVYLLKWNSNSCLPVHRHPLMDFLCHAHYAESAARSVSTQVSRDHQTCSLLRFHHLCPEVKVSGSTIAYMYSTWCILNFYRNRLTDSCSRPIIVCSSDSFVLASSAILIIKYHTKRQS